MAPVNTHETRLLRSVPEWLQTKPRDTAHEDAPTSQHREGIRASFSRIARLASTFTKTRSSKSRSTQEQSTIHSLPPELILEICDKLDGVDILSLCHTSKWFLSIYKENSRSLSVSQNDKAHFCRDWTESTYARSAREEMRIRRDGQPPAAALGCSLCFLRHPISAFTETERDKLPCCRRCLGSTGKVRMCLHHAFTLEELWQYQGRNNLMCCPFASTFGYVVGQQSLMYFGKTESIFIDEWLGYSAWPVCRSYLLRPDRYICPHMQTEDVRLQQLLSAQMPWPIESYSNGPLMVIASVRCEYAHCDTVVSVYRKDLLMWVDFKRNFGTLWDGATQKWCAQLERDAEGAVIEQMPLRPDCRLRQEKGPHIKKQRND
jgi:hypothetical protein